MLVRSPYLFNGYWNRPEETARAFADGWLATGDLGRHDDEGYLYLVDRRDDKIVSGGVNIYPREVEEVLARHPAVLEVAVFGVPDDYWGEAVHAVVAPRHGAEVGRARAARLRGGLARRATSCRRRSSSPMHCRATQRESCCAASCASPSGPVASAASPSR